MLFYGGVHGGAVVLGGTDPTVAQNMTAHIRVVTLPFFRNGDAELLFLKCLHSLLGEARLLEASELENDHNS